ncbi:unnamed protein product [Strongylus vulgaris]|uniref:Uncharacterized protein n=1 Tax=Strongylus vulgaris TaxID=40348 RepID=A0A3P7JPD5_STRVU|nr:unnamed protein product [Strongylus vulgaris]
MFQRQKISYERIFRSHNSSHNPLNLSHNVRRPHPLRLR